MRAAARCALLLLGALSSNAVAHPLAPALLDLRENPDGTTAVTWRRARLVVPGAPPLEPRLPAACVPGGTPEDTVADGALTSRWTVRCAGGLVGATVAVDGLAPARTQALLRIALADERVLQHVLRPDASTFVVPDRAARGDVILSYGRLGAEHIATGADHLLFVFGLLLLVPGIAPLARTITAFTLGHSLTLSLVALGAVTVSARWAELAIALTVFALASELARSPTAPTLLRRFPWAMALAFGLLHGLGFAGALREVGLPDGEIPLALFGFNLGIEVGQLIFVAVVLVAARGCLRFVRAPAWFHWVPVYAMGSLAACWSLQRAAVFFR